jgi:predicted porin
MRKHSLCIAGLALALLWPGLVGAADLTISGTAESEYDDNVFRNARDEEDDVLFRFVPSVRLHEDRGQDFLYSLEYRVPLEFAVDNGEELDDIDHLAAGRVTYHVSDRTDLFARNRFGYLRGQQRDVTVTDVSGTRVNTERDRVTRNDAEVGVEHRFSPRLLGSAAISHQLFEIDRDDRADNWLLDASADLLYALTPKHQLGGGVRYLRQEFDETQNTVASELNTVNVFAQWQWQIDETLDLSVSAGPSWIDNDQDDPPASVTVAEFPGFTLTSSADVTGLGYVNPDRTPAAGVFAPGSVLVSQVDACPTLAPPASLPVITDGTFCPPGNNPTPQTALVIIPAGDPLIASLASQTTVGQVDAALNPVEAKGDDSTSIDIFGQVVLRKRWTPNFQSALRYSRTQAGASGLGGAVIRDEVSLANNWDFSERWQLFARADWSLRQTIDEATSSFRVAQGNNLGQTAEFTQVVGLTTVRGENTEIDTMRWGVAGRLTHLFTRNTSAWVELTYNEQDSNGGSLGAGSDFTNFLATIGVRHVFEPIKLW